MPTPTVGIDMSNFEEALPEAGLPLYAINPYQVRYFARSQGAPCAKGRRDLRVHSGAHWPQRSPIFARPGRRPGTTAISPT